MIADRSPSGHAPERIPVLDGFRALAITMVLVNHGIERMPAAAANALSFLAYAGIGVRIFFVLSGYLITRLLKGELQRTGTIGLRKFYVRRALRILPAYLAFILAMVWASSSLGLAVSGHDVAAALTFTTNYVGSTWWLAHTWSLSVEEQFYLLWPFILGRLGVERGIRVAFVVVLAAPALRVLLYVASPALRSNPGAPQYTIDALMIGAAFALIEGDARFEGLLSRLVRGRIVAAALVGMVVVIGAMNLRAHHAGLIMVPFADSVLNLGIILSLVWLLRSGASTPLSRGLNAVLNAPPVVWLGGLSYSLYLWQQPFLTHVSHGPLEANNSWSGTFPLNYCCAFVCAIASYKLVEKPALRFRDSLFARWRLHVTAPPGILAPARFADVGEHSSPKQRPSL